MKKEETEEAVERLLDIAMKDDGEVYFHNTFLYKDNIENLKGINLLLSCYGTIHGKMINDSWTYFTISKDGIEFMEQGGFKGKREKGDYQKKMESLNLEIAELQKDKLNYERRIRHQESIIRLHKYIIAVSWFVTAALALFVALSE